MKKYLMTGIAALTMFAGFTSCSHNDDIEVYTQSQIDKAKYDQAFLNYIGGKIAEGQDWGFSADITAASRMTRGFGFTRGHNANANEWGRTWEVPETLTNAQKERVRLYFQYNNKPQGVSINYKDFFVQDVYKGATNPLNDGTDAKAQYSKEVYKFGNDMVAGSAHMDKLTAGSDNDHINNYNNAHCSTNDNVWDGVTYEAGYPLTAATAAAQGIGDWQAENYNHVVYHSDQIMLMVDSKTDCFGWYETNGSLQQNDHYVIISGETIDTWASQNGNPGASVAGRYFVGFDYEAQINLSDLYQDPDGYDEWVYNAETGITEPIHYDGPRKNADGITYLKNNTNEYAHTIVPTGTEGAYPVWQRDYWVIPGCADGYYSDWIVAITPGVLKETPVIEEEVYDIRIMGEDLSATEAGDFDFNDIVLDVKFAQTGETTTKVCLRAAGGTLPLYIIAGGESFEVHNLFKVGTGVMVNTAAGHHFDVPAKEFELKTNVANAEEARDKIVLKVDKNGELQELTAKIQEPAAKIAITSVAPGDWLDERVSIKDVKTQFVDWASANRSRSTWWNE